MQVPQDGKCRCVKYHRHDDDGPIPRRHYRCAGDAAYGGFCARCHNNLECLADQVPDEAPEADSA